MRNLLKKTGSEKGQALVEMALALPLLLLIIWGIVEFGRIGHAYLTLTHAAREGARMGAVGYSDEAITGEIQARTVSLPDNSITVIITPPEQERYAGTSFRVEIEYAMQLFLPVLSQALQNPYPVKTATVMRVE